MNPEPRLLVPAGVEALNPTPKDWLARLNLLSYLDQASCTRSETSVLRGPDVVGAMSRAVVGAW